MEELAYIHVNFPWGVLELKQYCERPERVSIATSLNLIFRNKAYNLHAADSLAFFLIIQHLNCTLLE
jgi:hypothetical protein